MVCFYHLDDDGKCAAALVKYYGQHDNYPDQFFEMNYGFEIPFDKINKDEIVYIVDFSIEPEDMLKLMEITQNITWIDHHVTAISKYEDFPHNIRGLRSNSFSGCMLTFIYLKERFGILDRKPEDVANDMSIPQVVRYCDDYDMWRFCLASTRKFHMGFSLNPHDPENCIWDVLIKSDDINVLREFIRSGESIEKYRSIMMEELIKSYGYESVFEGHPCYVLNQGIASSNDFESLDVTKYDMLVAWVYNGEKYSYSLRSVQDKVNVSEIAKKYGGGGHTSAAGFSSEELLVHRVAEPAEAE